MDGGVLSFSDSDLEELSDEDEEVVKERKAQLRREVRSVGHIVLGEDGFVHKTVKGKDVPKARRMRDFADPIFASQVPKAAEYIDEEGVYRFDVLPWPLEDAGLERIIETSGGRSVGAWAIEGVDSKELAVQWGYDLIGGTVPDNEKNALLSEAAKTWIFRMHTEGGWSSGALAKLFRVRQQRVMAIIALKQHEKDSEARWKAEGLSKREQARHEDVADMMQHYWGAHEDMGVGERHVRLLPAFPAFEVQEVEPEDLHSTDDDEDAAARGSNEEGLDEEQFLQEEGSETGSNPDEDEFRSGEDELRSGVDTDELDDEKYAAGARFSGRDEAEGDEGAEGGGSDLEEWSEDEVGDEYEAEGEGEGEGEGECASGSGQYEGEDGDGSDSGYDEDYSRWLSGRQGLLPSQEGVPPPGPGGVIVSELDGREIEMARREEIIMVREFQRDLAYNMAKVGAGIDRKSRKREAPKRPKGGYAVLVRPARRGVRFQPFVAAPDGTRRPLTEDEALYLGRQVPRARRRIL
ncbi:hypothetical protein WJX81_007603 [Elliptochloris bilobata]|uniref:Uncharacterized protein n=1 Tax=Elliptochloris bilobata TaxID=381761 RepID=A0AAW1SGR7_9CHLO